MLSRFVVAFCLLPLSALAMVGGQPVAEGSLFAKTSVMILFGNQNRCTGVIIAPKLILTAAHCARMEPASYKIAFTRDLTPHLGGGTNLPLRRVIKIALHPDLAKTDQLSDDMAVMTLDQPVPPGFEVAKLPESEMQIADGESMTSIGCGLMNSIGMLLPMRPSHEGDTHWEPVRLDAKTFLVGQPEIEDYLGIKLLFHRLFAAQLEGGVCSGDSGGPVFDESGVLVAINGANVPSFKRGENLPVCAAGVSFTRIDTALEWLRSQTSGN